MRLEVLREEGPVRRSDSRVPLVPPADCSRAELRLTLTSGQSCTPPPSLPTLPLSHLLTNTLLPRPDSTTQQREGHKTPSAAPLQETRLHSPPTTEPPAHQPSHSDATIWTRAATQPTHASSTPSPPARAMSKKGRGTQHHTRSAAGATHTGESPFPSPRFCGRCS